MIYSSGSSCMAMLFSLCFCCVIVMNLFMATNGAMLRRKIDNHNDDGGAVLSPDLITPVIVETRQNIDVNEILDKKVTETRAHMERVAKQPGFKKQQRRHPEFQEAITEMNQLHDDLLGSSEEATTALETLSQQQQFVKGMYPPRDALYGAAVGEPASSNITNTSSNNTVVKRESEEQFRNVIEKIDHTSQMAGAALYKSHVADDKVVQRTNLAFDSISALTKAKSKDIMEMLQEALKYLTMAKKQLSNAKKRNSTLVKRLVQTEGTDLAKLLDSNPLVQKAYKKVKHNEEIVVRAETAVREAQSALKLANRTDTEALTAKGAQGLLKEVKTKSNALMNKANEANIVANQDDLVEAALASKGDAGAAKKLYTQQTEAHEALRGAASSALEYQPTVTSTKEKTRAKELKAFITADAELDAEERAAIALDKVRADFKDKQKQETFATDVVEKTKKETKSPSEVDSFDYHEFKLNHTKYGDPEGFANSVMDELLKRAITDSDTGVLAPLMPQSYRKVEIKNTAAKALDSTSAVIRGFDIANFARKCLKDDQLQAKKAAETTKLYEEMVVPGSDNEPMQRMKVTFAQDIEEEVEKKLQADDELLEASREVIAALKYSDQRKIKTKEVEIAVLKASTSVSIAHRELDKAEKGIDDITNLAEQEKLWALRFKEAGAQSKLHKALLNLATESNTTNKAEVDVIAANYKIALAKHKRLEAIHAIRRHELKINEDDPAPTLKEPEFGNTTEIMVALHSAENEVNAQKKYMDAFVESVTLRYEAQVQAAKLALKKSQALLSVAAINAPGMTGGPAVHLEGPTVNGGTGGATGAETASATGSEGQYNPGIDSATGVSAGTSTDDAIDETEGKLEANVAHLNTLSEVVELYKRGAQAAQKDADAGSNIILSEEATKAEENQLGNTKSNRKSTSIISQVLPSEGIQAARDVFEHIYQHHMPSDKVMEIIEK